MTLSEFKELAQAAGFKVRRGAILCRHLHRGRGMRRRITQEVRQRMGGLQRD